MDLFEVAKRQRDPAVSGIDHVLEVDEQTLPAAVASCRRTLAVEHRPFMCVESDSHHFGFLTASFRLGRSVTLNLRPSIRCRGACLRERQG